MKTTAPHVHSKFSALCLAAILPLAIPIDARKNAEPPDTGPPPIVAATPPPLSWPKTAPQRQLPFTFAQMVSTIQQSFLLQPEQQSPHYALFRMIWTDRDDQPVEQFRMEVEDLGAQIAVTFSYREGIGSHYVGEFFEMPLFTEWESEYLYELLFEKFSGPRWTEFPRFQARIDISEDVLRTRVTLRLAPKARD